MAVLLIVLGAALLLASAAAEPQTHLWRRQFVGRLATDVARPRLGMTNPAAPAINANANFKLLTPGSIRAPAAATSMKPLPEKVEQVEYRVVVSNPPPFRRSYTIIATPHSVGVTVNDLEAVVGATTSSTRPLTPAQFRKLADLALGCRSCTHTGREAADCVGGRSEVVAYSAAGGRVVASSIYRCGGRHTDGLCDSLRAFATAMVNLLPDVALVQRLN